MANGKFINYQGTKIPEKDWTSRIQKESQFNEVGESNVGYASTYDSNIKDKGVNL